MPTELGPQFPGTYLGFPTHMSTEDYGIWGVWAPTVRHRWRELYFDVRLGAGRENVNTDDPALARMWLRSTQKRADVVALADDGVWLIELRSNAQLNAVGRLLGYVKLWNEAPALPGALHPFLITDNTDPDVAALCADHGITYTVNGN